MFPIESELVLAEKSLDIDLTNLRIAAERTELVIKTARDKVEESLKESLGVRTYLDDIGIDIYAFGSIGRAEMGLFSDFDFLIVANKMVTSPRDISAFRKAAKSAQEALGIEDPGESGLFGGVVGAPDLVTVIGLNEDSNLHMSRRILILQESVALNARERRDATVLGILQRYLNDYEPGGDSPQAFVPRFLLNDIARFWRTVAVDYQAKRWHEMTGKKWGLRYIKLRSSRKWSFAGNLIAVWMPYIAGTPTTHTALHEQFQKSPLARIAQLSQYLPEGATQARGALADVLQCADWFVGNLGQEAWRKSIQGVENPRSAQAPAEFKEAQAKTSDLQKALESLFFSDEVLRRKTEDGSGSSPGVSLGELTRKYLSF